GKAYAGSKIPMADGHAYVPRLAAEAANVDIVGIGVPALQAAVATVHQREVFIPQTKAYGQPPADLPAVLEVRTEQPFARFHREILDRLVVAAHQPEQTRGIGVGSARNFPRQDRGRAADIDIASWILCLGLPMGHLISSRLKAPAHLVSAADVGEVGAELVRALRARNRRPTLRKADAGEAEPVQ